eukprot:scaffold100030_cov22-Tisochrysis_lutea.AAC.2
MAIAATSRSCISWSCNDWDPQWQHNYQCQSHGHCNDWHKLHLTATRGCYGQADLRLRFSLPHPSSFQHVRSHAMHLALLPVLIMGSCAYPLEGQARQDG